MEGPRTMTVTSCQLTQGCTYAELRMHPNPGLDRCTRTHSIVGTLLT